MKLTIIIVNFNVKYFLEQSLRSVYRSNFKQLFEVIVVDNASEDGSIAMLKKDFPQVNLIENRENVGFSKANNQGIQIATGEFVLLLNPDTILSEETLSLCVDKMESDPQIGGLGVRMIDGGGTFLPESKRGLPSPRVAFFKAFGLSKLFPGSRYFNYYHLGHIPETESSEVDVLSGAFMMMRKALLNEIGGLDETFFMYGEDIDLSYRIQKSGYKNWYEATTSIVHFKGESTKKGSLNYVKVFYKAMIIFARKHFVGTGAIWMILLYQIAVTLRAGVSLISNFVRSIFPMLLEGGIIFLGLQILARIWAKYYFNDVDYYASVPLHIHHAIYSIVWVLSMYLGGAYDKYFSYRNLWRSLLFGTGILLIAFSLVSSELRPSRAIVLLGVIWTIGTLSLMRGIWAAIQGVSVIRKKRIAVVGSLDEIRRTEKLLEKSRVPVGGVFYISPTVNASKGYIGELQDLEDIVDAYQLDEVIFCARDVEHAEIISWMTRFSDGIPVKIIQEESAGIIGSRYKNKQGELYAIDAQLSIVQREKKRQKRTWDLLMCMGLLLLIPFWIWLPGAARIGSNWWKVLIGMKTWLGYDDRNLTDVVLPKLKPAVFNVADQQLEPEVRERINFLYAKDYSVWMDFDLFWKALKRNDVK